MVGLLIGGSNGGIYLVQVKSTSIGIGLPLPISAKSCISEY